MTGPRRIQYVRGKSLPPNASYVGRGSRYGNPFKVADPRSLAQRTEAVRRFRLYLHQPEQTGVLLAIRTLLPGQDLACYCRLDGLPCHAGVCLEEANPAGSIQVPRLAEIGCVLHRVPPGQACSLCLYQLDLFPIRAFGGIA